MASIAASTLQSTVEIHQLAHRAVEIDEDGAVSCCLSLSAHGLHGLPSLKRSSGAIADGHAQYPPARRTTGKTPRNDLVQALEIWL